MSRQSFGKLDDGREARLFTLVNAHGLRARVSDFGATLVSMETPDRNGELADITLGYDEAAPYAGPSNPYLGATVGRFGNRIAHGRFELDGRPYELATNNDPGGIPCHLHGGEQGFNRRLWTVVGEPGSSRITFEHVSPDGEEGYPGTLVARVTYQLTDDNELVWEATATTDAPTIVNLVHHSYWNLSGDPTRAVLGHELSVHADHYLPTDAGMIPTGERAPVAGTPMDFTWPTRIGERIDDDFEALRIANGYDHCWVLRAGDGLVPAARLHDPASGRTLEVATDQPGIHVYTGNFLSAADFDGNGRHGKGGRIYDFRSACCLETENFPDSPNQPDFPSPVLLPGREYRHQLVHRFSVD